MNYIQLLKLVQFIYWSVGEMNKYIFLNWKLNYLFDLSIKYLKCFKNVLLIVCQILYRFRKNWNIFDHKVIEALYILNKVKRIENIIIKWTFCKNSYFYPWFPCSWSSPTPQTTSLMVLLNLLEPYLKTI